MTLFQRPYSRTALHCAQYHYTLRVIIVVVVAALFVISVDLSDALPQSFPNYPNAQRLPPTNSSYLRDMSSPYKNSRIPKRSTDSTIKTPPSTPRRTILDKISPIYKLKLQRSDDSYTYSTTDQPTTSVFQHIVSTLHDEPAGDIEGYAKVTDLVDDNNDIWSPLPQRSTTITTPTTTPVAVTSTTAATATTTTATTTTTPAPLKIIYTRPTVKPTPSNFVTDVPLSIARRTTRNSTSASTTRTTESPVLRSSTTAKISKKSQSRPNNVYSVTTKKFNENPSTTQDPDDEYEEADEDDDTGSDTLTSNNKRAESTTQLNTISPTLTTTTTTITTTTTANTTSSLATTPTTSTTKQSSYPTSASTLRSEQEVEIAYVTHPTGYNGASRGKVSTLLRSSLLLFLILYIL